MFNGILSDLRGDAPRELQPGETIGSYQVIEFIGKGGMGHVYKVSHEQTNEIFALKAISPRICADEYSRARFLTEAQAMSELHHNNIVSLHEVGVSGKVDFFTMNFISGQSLKELIQDKTYPQDKLLNILIQVCDAISYAHQQGIIHRDLKPENILVDTTNNHPYVMDFGLAKVLREQKGLTQTGSIMGTLNYISPEQATGHRKDIDHRTDIYSLGAILYEILSGSAPFSESKGMGVLKKIICDQPQPIRQVAPGIPRKLEKICSKAISRDKNQRYSSAQLLKQELSSFLHKQQQKRKLLRKTFLLVLLLAIALFVYILSQNPWPW